MNILNMLQEIFMDIFDDDTLVLSRDTNAGDVEDWDSLAQVNIIVACESKFKVKFGLNDIAKLQNVGDIMDAIEMKLKK